MDLTTDRELVLSRVYEHALRSAYAHGSTLTDFSFSLPQPDDVLVFPNGNKAYRKDTSDSGYSDDEQSHYDFLLQNVSVRNGFKPFPALTIPSAFLDDTDTILESHLNNLSEIARGLIRDAQRGAQDVAPLRIPAALSVTFATFTRASFAFHEALLHATDAFLHIDHAPTAARLMHELFPALLEAQESLTLATRRLSHPDLERTIEKGAQHQIHLFLASGQNLGQEPDFFTLHSSR